MYLILYLHSDDLNVYMTESLPNIQVYLFFENTPKQKCNPQNTKCNWNTI